MQVGLTTGPGATTDSVVAKAKELEGVLIGQLVNAMFATLGDDMPGGSGEEMFRGVLAEKVGAQAARGPGVGLSASVVETMINLQQGRKE